MWIRLISLSVTLAYATIALAQEPPPKRPDLPDLGKFDPNSAEWVAKRWCDGNMLTVVSKSPFSVTANTKGGQFESEIARHSCNQECRGATHEVCAAGTCYSVHNHEDGVKLKWDQTKTDEIVTKISASLKAALPKGAEISGGFEQEIKKSISNATSAEQTLRGCLANPCTIRTEAGGFLLAVNPGQVVISGYHVFTVVYQCTTSGHWLYPDAIFCGPGKKLNSWYSTEITDIQFHGGLNMTFTKWLVPGPSCACKPGHRIVPPPDAPPKVPTGTGTREKVPAPRPPVNDEGCGCGKKRAPTIVLPPTEPRTPWMPPRWSPPWPPTDGGREDHGGTPPWLPPDDGGFVPPTDGGFLPPGPKLWTDGPSPREGREVPTEGESCPGGAPTEEKRPHTDEEEHHEER